MAYDYYSGTSAYKLDQYEQYTRKNDEKQKIEKVKKAKLSKALKKRLIIAMCAAFAIASVFLYTNVVLIQTSSRASELADELEDMKVRNTQASFDIASGVDYSVVEQKAVSEFGMQHPESYQNVYVDVVQSDYAELANEAAPAKGVVESLICSVQSFLAYIK